MNCAACSRHLVCRPAGAAARYYLRVNNAQVVRLAVGKKMFQAVAQRHHEHDVRGFRLVLFSQAGRNGLRIMLAEVQRQRGFAGREVEQRTQLRVPAQYLLAC